MDWTIRTALDWTQAYLTGKGEENPRLASQWLLSAATQLERIELYTHYHQPLSVDERARLREGIQRRVAGEPLQYILGRAPFRHLELAMRPGVLIPRPETEVLVEVVLAEMVLAEEPRSARPAQPAQSPQPARSPQPPQPARSAQGSANTPLLLLDIGTGSGAIALSLLQECPHSEVVATDIDPTALALAAENAETLGLRERLILLADDLASSLVADPAWSAHFDVVMSNPPYIPTAELDKLPNEIAQYESRQALDGGTDGLAVFRRILDQALVLLAPGGLLACELHESTLGQAVVLAEQAGFVAAKIHRDLTDRERIVTARKAAL
ncbi:MAG: peptide chain release factor N(5)-glutamine methyltransferase [Coriobacteriales bacterium]|nr:peptide chain release factor N(5)-glutamine methyltransferase [Coriobacteriales bacterium]